jgi:Caspase domain
MLFRCLILLIGLAFAGPALAQQTRGAVVVTPTDTKRPVTLYSKSYALVIGIDRYTGGWRSLNNAIKDAEAIAAELKQRGFEVRLEKNLTSGKLDRAFKSFLTGPGADPNARLLIWFAGHGYSLERRLQKNVYDGYLIPADAKLPPGDPVKDYVATGQFKNSAFEIAKIGLYMQQANSRHVLAIMDSCFSGTVFERRSPTSLSNPNITQKTIAPVRQLISAGKRGQEVADDGLFRRLFLDAITGREADADSNSDGYVTGSELGRFLSYWVAHYTKNVQEPQAGKLSHYGLDRGDFVFVHPKTKKSKDALVTSAYVRPPSTSHVVSPRRSHSADQACDGKRTLTMSGARNVLITSSLPGTAVETARDGAPIYRKGVRFNVVIRHKGCIGRTAFIRSITLIREPTTNVQTASDIDASAIPPQGFARENEFKAVVKNNEFQMISWSLPSQPGQKFIGRNTENMLDTVPPLKLMLTPKEEILSFSGALRLLDRGAYKYRLKLAYQLGNANDSIESDAFYIANNR